MNNYSTIQTYVLYQHYICQQILLDNNIHATCRILTKQKMDITQQRIAFLLRSVWRLSELFHQSEIINRTGKVLHRHPPPNADCFLLMKYTVSEKQNFITGLRCLSTLGYESPSNCIQRQIVMSSLWQQQSTALTEYNVNRHFECKHTSNREEIFRAARNKQTPLSQ